MNDYDVIDKITAIAEDLGWTARLVEGDTYLELEYAPDGTGLGGAVHIFDVPTDETYDPVEYIIDEAQTFNEDAYVYEYLSQKIQYGDDAIPNVRQLLKDAERIASALDDLQTAVRNEFDA